MTVRAEQGFTLLEMLVAMAVLSLGALALLNLAGQNIRAAGVLEERLFAGVVAELNAIPVKYQSPLTSDLKATVTADENTVEFHMKK